MLKQQFHRLWHRFYLKLWPFLSIPCQCPVFGLKKKSWRKLICHSEFCGFVQKFESKNTWITPLKGHVFFSLDSWIPKLYDNIWLLLQSNFNCRVISHSKFSIDPVSQSRTGHATWLCGVPSWLCVASIFTAYGSRTLTNRKWQKITISIRHVALLCCWILISCQSCF